MRSKVFEHQALLLTQGRARHIDGHVAAADHNYFLTDRKAITKIDVQQKIYAFDYAIKFVARHRQVTAPMQTERKQNSLETLSAEICKRKIPAQTGIQLKRDTQVQNFANLCVQHIARQTIFRNTQTQHATRNRRCIENRYWVTQQSQVVCGGESGRSGTNYRYLVRA